MEFPEKIDFNDATPTPLAKTTIKKGEHRIELYNPKLGKDTAPEQVYHLYLDIVPELCRQSLASNIFAYQHLRSYGEGKIFVLLGNSTAGKSSIIKALMKQNPRWEESGPDMYFPLLDAREIEKRAPQQYARLVKAMDPTAIGRAATGGNPRFRPNIPDAVRQDAEASLQEIKKMGIFDIPTKDADSIKKCERRLYDIVSQAMPHRDIAFAVFDAQEKWTKEPTPEQRKALEELRGKKDQFPSYVEEYSEEHERIMEEDVIEKAMHGGQVIFDPYNAMAFIDRMIEKNNFVSLKIGLAYCPFTVLAERVRLRNSNALKNNQENEYRLPLDPLIQFCNFFRPAKSGDTVIDTYHREDVEKALQSAYEQHKDFLRRQLPLSKASKDIEEFEKTYPKQKKEILEKLGFRQGVDVVNITPSHKNINLLFFTHCYRPEESAQKIEEIP
jgi:hypothetical protein